MGDSPRSQFNIFVVAELNGAKKFMYSDGLIGLAHYLKGLPEQERPNMFVVDGGLLPSMPLNRGGARNQDALSTVVDGVRNLDGAASVMKPHMERIQAELPEDADFIYVMGKADQKNIEDMKLKLSRLYSRAQGKMKQGGQNIIEPYVQEADVEISSREAILESLGMAEARLGKQLKDASGAEERAKLGAELADIRTNVKVNSGELNDFRERYELLKRLEELVYAHLPTDKVKERLGESEARLAEVSKQLDDTFIGTTEYKRLNKEAKLLGNRIRALSKRYKEGVGGTATEAMVSDLGREFRFIGRIPLPTDINTLLDSITKAEYRALLKDALGRKRDVTIQETSLEVYSRRVNGFGFNAVVTDGLNIDSSVYRRSSNSALVRTAFVVVENLGGENRLKIEAAPLNVLIGSRNGYNSFSMEPWADQSKSVVAALAKGPFISTHNDALQYLAKRKTDETQAVQKMILGSSASVIQVFGDGGVVHKTIKSQELEDERVKADREEAGALKKLVRKLDRGAKESTEAETPELSRAIMRSRMPSEVKGRELVHADEGLLRSLAPNAGRAAPNATRELRIAEITDAHVGNYGNLELLRAAAGDAMRKRPDVLVLSGDNLEGNLGDFKYAPRPENEFDIMEDFREWMLRKGMPETEVRAELLERYGKLRSSVISNIDEQAKVFVGAIQELAVDIVQRGGYVIAVSGNHYNKTQKGWERDEATAIISSMELVLGGTASAGKLPKDWKEHLKRGSGENMGAEKFSLDGIGIEVKHGLTEKVSVKQDAYEAAMESKRNHAALIITGHGHSLREVSNARTEVVQGLAMQATTTYPYLKTLNEPFSSDERLSGYLFINAKVRDKEVVEYNLEPRLREQLMIADTNFMEFLRDRRSMTKDWEKKGPRRALAKA